MRYFNVNFFPQNNKKKCIKVFSIMPPPKDKKEGKNTQPSDLIKRKFKLIRRHSMVC